MREERGQEKEKERKEGKVVIKVKKGTSKGLAKLALENMLVKRMVSQICTKIWS